MTVPRPSLRRALPALALALLAGTPPVARAAAPHHIQLALLHTGPAPAGTESSLQALALEVRLRTSLEVAGTIPRLRPDSRGIFDHPLLYWAGDRGGARVSDKAIALLREHLLTGGTLIIDNTGRAGPSAPFDAEVRRVVTRATGRPLARIAPTHVIFRSFYRLARPVGRRADTGHLEGVRVGKHYAVIYTRDDLLGAFLRSPTGGPALRVVPRGEAQREQAFRLAINLVMYAVCLDYKDDHTHVTHLLRTRRGREPPRGRRDVP